VGEVTGLLAESEYVAVDKLSETEKAFISDHPLIFLLFSFSFTVLNTYKI